MSTTTDSREIVATQALELQKQIDGLTKQLNEKKEELRDIANGNKLEVTIEGLGKINVSTPRSGSEKVVLTFDEKRLAAIPELKSKLIEKGIAKEEIRKTPDAKASVTIKPNV